MFIKEVLRHRIRPRYHTIYNTSTTSTQLFYMRNISYIYGNYCRITSHHIELLEKCIAVMMTNMVIIKIHVVDALVALYICSILTKNMLDIISKNVSVE